MLYINFPSLCKILNRKKEKFMWTHGLHEFSLWSADFIAEGLWEERTSRQLDVVEENSSRQPGNRERETDREGGTGDNI